MGESCDWVALLACLSVATQARLADDVIATAPLDPKGG